MSSSSWHKDICHIIYHYINISCNIKQVILLIGESLLKKSSIYSQYLSWQLSNSNNYHYFCLEKQMITLLLKSKVKTMKQALQLFIITLLIVSCTKKQSNQIEQYDSMIFTDAEIRNQEIQDSLQQARLDLAGRAVSAFFRKPASEVRVAVAPLTLLISFSRAMQTRYSAKCNRKEYAQCQRKRNLQYTSEV